MNELTYKEKEFEKIKLRDIAMDLMNKLDDVKDFNSKVAIASAFNVLMDTCKGL